MRLERLAVERAEGVVRITLSGEVLGDREAGELVAVAGILAEDASVRVVVVASRGDDFCPGADDALEPLAFEPDPAGALAALRPPVIAACRGRASSVGLELALAADVRMADATARFALADVERARLPCWGGTQRLPRAIGRPRATAMVLLGEELDADTASSAGLVHRVVAAGRLDDAVDALVAELTALAPLALELAKEAIARGSELPMGDALRLEGDLNHLLQTTADRAEGLQAFFDKRAARFTGT